MSLAPFLPVEPSRIKLVFSYKDIERERKYDKTEMIYIIFSIVTQDFFSTRRIK